MPEKRDLDDTDLEIVRLLAEDARRSYSDIAEHIDLSPPAVSDRIDRLVDQEIIRRFTLDIDRTKVQRRTPVLVELQPTPESVESVYAAICDLDGVEHAFQTVDGRILAHASTPDDRVGAWLRSNVDMSSITSFDITLLEHYTWEPEVGENAFSLSCVVCGNPVHSEGITAEIGGETKAFCCPSCKGAYEERYEAHRSAE